MITNESKIEKYMMIDIDSSFSSQITDWINAVELYINNYTGIEDGFESASSIKYFNGNNEREIIIDKCTEITTIEVLEADGGDVEWTLTEGMESDYITFPYNKTPIFKLILRPSAQIGSWYKGNKRIKITAHWGQSSSVPKDIELAATMLVSSIIEKGLRGGKVGSESLGDYSISYVDIDDSAQVLGVKRILDKYKIFKL